MITKTFTFGSGDSAKTISVTAEDTTGVEALAEHAKAQEVRAKAAEAERDAMKKQIDNLRNPIIESIKLFETKLKEPATSEKMFGVMELAELSAREKQLKALDLEKNPRNQADAPNKEGEEANKKDKVEY